MFYKKSDISEGTWGVIIIRLGEERTKYKRDIMDSLQFLNLCVLLVCVIEIYCSFVKLKN